MGVGSGFNLDRLKSPFDFPLEEGDGIKSVKITFMRLKPYNEECCVTVEVPKNGSRNIHDIIRDAVNCTVSALNSLVVEEVELSVELVCQAYEKQSDPLIIRIKSSGHYELEDENDEIGILIICKYTKYWGLHEHHN